MMKKVLLMLVLVLPIICNAEEEVKYRWFNYQESNVQYVTDPESVCEYFDKNDYKYSDYIYSLTMPEIKEGREITSDYKDYTFLRKYVNKLGITRFTGATEYDFYELEILDEEGNSINYDFSRYLDNYYLLNDNDFNNPTQIFTHVNMDIVFEEPIDIENTSIRITYKNVKGELDGIKFQVYMTDEYVSNYYAGYSTINTHTCDEDVCVFTAKVDKTQMSTTDVIVKTKVYKYRDTLYKCYDLVKTYANGYYDNLEGYIKDENDYIVTNNLTTEEVNSIINDSIEPLTKQNDELISEVTNLKSELNYKEEILNKIDNFKKSISDNDDVLNKINNLETLINEDNVSYESIITKLNTLENNNEDITELKEYITNIVNEDKTDNVVKLNDRDSTNKIAMVTKEEANKTSKNSVFILLFGLISLLISFTILIKNVIKCRKK